MKDQEKKAGKFSITLVGFVAGVLTVIIIIFAMKGC